VVLELKHADQLMHSFPTLRKKHIKVTLQYIYL